MADPVTNGPVERREPPAFNVPRPVLLLLIAIVGVYFLVGTFDLEMREQVLLYFAFFPSRYLPEGSAIAHLLPGGAGPVFWTPVTYTFLHGGLEHLVANSVWLLAFGSPLAVRLGAGRFFLFYFLCGAAGAFLHAFLYPGSDIPVVGASAAISGLMGGAARFVFLSGGPLGALGGRGAGNPYASRRRASILGALSDRRTLIFVVVWVGVNFLFGATVLGSALGAAQVAWEAHLGGFIMGLLIFGFFDPLRLSPSGGPGNVGYGEWLEKDPHERDGF